MHLGLELIVVDDLGHPPDNAAIGDDRIAAAHILDHQLVLRRALLLRAKEQHIHDGEDEDERRELHEHVGRAEAAGRLRIGWGDEQGMGLLGALQRPRVRLASALSSKFGADYSGGSAESNLSAN